MDLNTLETRFTEPANWQWQFFDHRKLKVRYGLAIPPSQKPEACVVILPGRTEYAEKYFETAHELLAQNFSVCVIDWPGQGQSQRFAKLFPERGHALAFHDYAAALHVLLKKQIKSNVPLVMLAHSMGANIGLRYLKRYPEIFSCAAFSAPLLGIKQLAFLPFAISIPLLWVLDRVAGNHYAYGEKNWSDEKRDDTWRFSSDPVRCTIHNGWMRCVPALQLGGATYGWVYRAVKSCAILQKPQTAPSIKTPCLMVVAGKETLVDNRAAKTFARRMPNCIFKDIPDSGHEIIMETDEVRSEFFAYFYTLVHENIV